MEAMARGCSVMATPVGDIPYHVHTNKNGFLFSSIDADVVTKEAIDWLQQLDNNKSQLQQFCSIAKDYAFKNFGIEQFNQQYKVILHQNS
jgi:glycosyltransferase involved in cell wall biosynthesis